MKLLFVCTGNICRSPLAEGFIRYLCFKKSLDLECDSAAIYNYHTGSHPDPRAIQIAENYGFDISHLKARKINKSDFSNFDLIIGMDKNHIKELNKINKYNKNICLYLNFSQNLKNNDVPDPYYGSLIDFERSFNLIRIGAEAIINELFN